MDNTNESVPEQRLVEALLEAVHQRQAADRVTTLRDLHGLLGISQPEALRLANQVESEGWIVVEGDPMDRFASIISFNPSKPRRLSGEKRTWNPFAK
ncbi:MAG: hypothetical protein AAF553_05885 [Pseudomonadota bacterium]